MDIGSNAKELSLKELASVIAEKAAKLEEVAILYLGPQRPDSGKPENKEPLRCPIDSIRASLAHIENSIKTTTDVLNKITAEIGFVN